MPQQRPHEELPEERRQEIYQALADEQDLYEYTAEQAHQRVAHHLGISAAQLYEIEDEGREKLWPPF